MGRMNERMKRFNQKRIAVMVNQLAIGGGCEGTIYIATMCICVCTCNIYEAIGGDREQRTGIRDLEGKENWRKDKDGERRGRERRGESESEIHSNVEKTVARDTPEKC